MPHVIVKTYPGRSEQQKAQLAEAITQQVMAIARVGADAVSVAIEEITAKDWPEQVYRPDILGMPTNYTKNPDTTRWLSGTCLGKAL